VILSPFLHTYLLKLLIVTQRRQTFVADEIQLLGTLQPCCPDEIRIFHGNTRLIENGCRAGASEHRLLHRCIFTFIVTCTRLIDFHGPVSTFIHMSSIDAIVLKDEKLLMSMLSLLLLLLLLSQNLTIKEV